MRSDDKDKTGKSGKTGKTKQTIDRRELIKRAAATGGAAWAAPLILSTPASAAQISNAALGGCFKYMFDWRWAGFVQACSGGLGSPQNDATPCAQNTGENHSTQKYPNPNCCEDKRDVTTGAGGPGGEGNVLQWYELSDIPPGCITVSSTQPCADSGEQVTVTFTVSCQGCYITDGMVRYDASGRLVTPVPNYCANASVSETGFASSKLIEKSVSVTFTQNKVPVWFKFYVACGIDPNHPQNDGYFPDTDCQFFATDSTTI